MYVTGKGVTYCGIPFSFSCAMRATIIKLRESTWTQPLVLWRSAVAATDPLDRTKVRVDLLVCKQRGAKATFPGRCSSVIP